MLRAEDRSSAHHAVDPTGGRAEERIAMATKTARRRLADGSDSNCKGVSRRKPDAGSGFERGDGVNVYQASLGA